MADSPRIENRLREILSGAPRVADSRALRQTRLLSAIVGVLAVGGLAIVHPTLGQAKRPSPPKKGAQKEPVNPELTVKGPDGKHVEAGTLYPLPYDTVPNTPTFTRKYPGGVTIDLAAVAEPHVPPGMSPNLADAYPYKTNWTSWTPLGTPLPTIFINRSPNRVEDNLHPSRRFAFAFRLRPATDPDTETDYSVVNANITVMGGLDLINGHPVTPRENWRNGGFRVLDAALPKSNAYATIKLGVASGPWIWGEESTIASHPESTAQIGTTLGTPAQVSFGPPLVSKGRCGFLVTSTAKDCSTRVVAIDAAGKKHLPDRIDDNSTDVLQNFNHRVVWFDDSNVPLAKIRTIRFEARPYHWETFDHIALNSK